MALWPVHGEGKRWTAEIDVDAGTLVLTSGEPDSEPTTLRFHTPAEGTLVLEGPLEGTEQRMVLRRVDEQAMRLPSRGFRWINETPYNR